MIVVRKTRDGIWGWEKCVDTSNGLGMWPYGSSWEWTPQQKIFVYERKLGIFWARHKEYKSGNKSQTCKTQLALVLQIKLQDTSIISESVLCNGKSLRGMSDEEFSTDHKTRSFWSPALPWAVCLSALHKYDKTQFLEFQGQSGSFKYETTITTKSDLMNTRQKSSLLLLSCIIIVMIVHHHHQH